MKRKALILVMIIAAMVFAGCMPESAHSYTQISMQEAVDIMETEEN